MNLSSLYKKALNLENLSLEEGIALYKNAPFEELVFVANELRKKHVPGNNITWLIDRNVNITNVCISRCKFCNFHRIPGSTEAYVTTIEEYEEKINYLFEKGGDQLLLQGGMNPPGRRSGRPAGPPCRPAGAIRSGCRAPPAVRVGPRS
jgi:cyclic dehypoxanthinyl futalosine synthase